jgi:adenylosuccinate lyase
MSKKDKLEARIRNNLKNVTLDDFETLVSMYGRIEMGSKHAKARLGNATMTYKRVNPMPSEYVTDLLNIIDSL